jgi:hypothetical protein
VAEPGEFDAFQVHKNGRQSQVASLQSSVSS